MRKITFLFILSLILTSCFNRTDPEDTFLREISYKDLSTYIENLDEPGGEWWLNIIDVGSKTKYQEGFLEHAFNIDFNDPRHVNGYPLSFPEAVELFVDEQWINIVYSSSNNDEVYTAARGIYDMGYRKVYFYEKGLADWRENNGYLCIGDEGFINWFDNNYPFSNDSCKLLDINPIHVFEGTENDGGHIPGAYHLSLEDFVDDSGEILQVLDSGKILINLCQDTHSELYIYSDSVYSDRARLFIKGAQELGYGNITWFKDGRSLWTESGRELE